MSENHTLKPLPNLLIDDDSGHPVTLWFGESWGAPVCESDRHAETPVGHRCYDCLREVVEGDRGLLTVYVSSDQPPRYAPVHHDCFMASLGIGT